jgi:hypothetical protein
MNSIKKFLVVPSMALVSASLGLSVSVALATVNSVGNITSPVNSAADIQQLLCNIIDWFIWVVIIVSVIMIVYAAFEYATAGDDAEKVATGRKTITYAAIGILVALLAAGVPSIVASLFGNGTGGFTIGCLG